MPEAPDPPIPPPRRAAPPTIATSPATPSHRRASAASAAAALALAAWALPHAGQPLGPILPGLAAGAQAALLLLHALAAYLLLAQFLLTGSRPALALACGSLAAATALGVQSFLLPGVGAPGTPGDGAPAAAGWLWACWHAGPALACLAYAVLPAAAPARASPRALLLLGLGAAVTSAVLVLSVAATTWTSGPDPAPGPGGPLGAAACAVLSAAAAAALAAASRLRSGLQLAAAFSASLAAADAALTASGGPLGSTGWACGRVAAVASALTLAAFLLRELDLLRSRADAALEAAEAANGALAVALEAADMGGWDIPRGRPAVRTPRHDAILGIGPAQEPWGTSPFLGIVHPDDRDAVRDALSLVPATGRIRIECRVVRPDGSGVRSVSLLGSSYGPGGSAGLAGVVSDVTDARSVEARLRDAERMESVGQLTGGVAHDFNNILAVVSGCLELLLRTPADAPRVARLAGNALAAAARGADLTGKLLSFSRRQPIRPAVTDLGPLLDGVLPLLRAAAGGACPVSAHAAPGLWRVTVDPSQLEACLLDLVANARDAMPSGGPVSIGAANADLGPGAAADLGAAPGPHVELSVSDAGVGMDAATARSAFEPFFTTKDVGRGSGLGLSRVYGFARQAGGSARIVSAEGQGTRIVILLPKAPADAPSGPALPRAPDPRALPRARGEEAVLVVEDDTHLRGLASESLRELGYAVLTSPRSSDALERLRGPDRIDVLFSDVVLGGGMDGSALAAEARAVRPGLPVLLTSGLASAAAGDGGRVPGGPPMLPKPYTRAALAAALRQVLDA